MAKSKNHTANNDAAKNHKNGIKKPKKYRFTTTKGMCPKYLKNRYYAIKGLSGKKHAIALLRNAKIKKTAAKRKQKRRVIRYAAKKAKRKSDSQMKELQRIEKEKAARDIEKAFKKRFDELREQAKTWKEAQKKLAPKDREKPKNIYAELFGEKKSKKKKLTAFQIHKKREKVLARKDAKMTWEDVLALRKQHMEEFTREERVAYAKNKKFEADCAKRRAAAAVQRKLRENRVANWAKKTIAHKARIEKAKKKREYHASLKRKRVARHVGVLKKLGIPDPHASTREKREE